MVMRLSLIVGVVLYAVCGLVACKAGPAGKVGPFPRPADGRAVTAGELSRAVALSGDLKYRIKRVAQTPGAQIHVIQMTGEIKPYFRKKHDQIFFVSSGECIAEVGGIRDVVGPGSVVVVSRGKKFRIVRGDKHVGKPVVLVRVTLPNDNVQDRVDVKKKPKEKD